MEWLKDKKNAPIVATIAVVVIVGVGLCMWRFVISPPQAPLPDQTAQQTAELGAPPPDGTMMPAAPGTDVPAATAPAAAVTPAAGNGVQVASVTPMETWRSDPFQPIGYKPPARGRQPKPPIWDFPYMKLPIKLLADGGHGKKWEKPEIQQPSRRMAGILLNDRVYAIIESNGASQVVQPGDYTTDRLAMVERIEPDKVVLKTVDDKPRYITVRMAASPTVQSSPAGSTSPSGPPRYAPSAPGLPRGGAPGL